MTMFDFSSVYQAYIACRQGKRASHNTQRYEVDLLEHLVNTSELLQSRRWLPTRSVAFVCTRPKAREIHAADFADRVVHHVLVPKLEAIYEPVFIHDSYSNRKQKGTHAAVERLQQCMRKVSCNGKKRAFFLQLDIRNFFNRIDRTVLLQLLQARLKKSVAQQVINADDYQDIIWLCSILLNKNAAKGAAQRGSATSFDAVPRYKRLMYAPKHCGLAIGNLTSQFFANVYLNELDQYIKHHLKCHHYLRYVDDFVLLHESEAQLLAWREDIQHFLAEKLGLELKDMAVPKTIASGCDFLGYVTRPHYRLVRQRVLHHCLEKLADLEDKLLRKDAKGLSLGLGTVDREALQAMLASYFSHYQHASSFRLQQQMILNFPWLKMLFEFRVAAHSKYQLCPKWQPKGVCSFQSQYNWFAYHFVGFVQLIQLGKSFACRASDKIHFPAAVQKIMKKSNVLFGGQAMYVAGLSLLKGVRSFLRHSGIAHIFVAEQGYLSQGTRPTASSIHLVRGGLKRRVLRLLWLPSQACLNA